MHQQDVETLRRRADAAERTPLPATPAMVSADRPPRVFAALASVWGISVLVGPLIGGIFAYYENWRGALWARFHPPPRQTQHADFPHWAFLLTSFEDLCDRSGRARY